MERLARLFGYLMAHPERLPDFRDPPQPEDSPDQPEAKPLHRAVCDYIAGMTDGYFQRVYAALLS